MKRSYEEYCKDLKGLAILARRVGYANKHLSTDEAVHNAREFMGGARAFAAKYTMDTEAARNIAIHTSETLDLGLAH